MHRGRRGEGHVPAVETRGQVTREYFEDGLLKTVTRDNAVMASFVYDAAHRETSRSYANGG